MPVYPRELEGRFGHDHLIGQFAIARDPSLVPAGWPGRTLAGWHLASQDALPSFDVVHPELGEVGWMLGYLVAPDGEMVTGAVTMPDSPGEPLADSFERFVYHFAGRFLAILLTDGVSRLYLDPSGSLSAVYCPQLELIAATTSLIPYTDATPDFDELIDELKIPEQNEFYTFGLTPRKGVERLMPNHYLDLHTWRIRRHWPSGEFEVTTNIPDTVESIARATRRNIEAFAKHFPLHLSLTGGGDSRMLLACGRNVLDRIEFFTLQLDDQTGNVDEHLSRALARKFNLQHRVLPFLQPSQEELDLWLYRTGCAVGERRGRMSVRSYGQLDKSRVEMPGLAGELGRHAYFNESADLEHIRSGADVLHTLKIHSPRIAEERGDEWIASVPVEKKTSILPLILIEQRMVGWASILPYADPVSTRFRVYPFNERRIFEWMVSLPADYREQKKLGPDLIKVFWPELLSLPFNRYTGYKYWKRKAEWNYWKLRNAASRRLRGAK